MFPLLFPGPPNPDNLPEDGKLKSEMMTKDNKRYYLDLKENQRGRFLRVCHACISMLKLVRNKNFNQWLKCSIKNNRKGS